MNKVVLWLKNIGLKKLLFGVITLLIISGALFVLSRRGKKIEPKFQDALNAGDYSLAITELEPSIYKGEKDPGILKTVAAAYIQKAIAEKTKINQTTSVAISYLQAAIASNGDNSENYRLLGVAHSLRGELDKARKNFDKALSIDSENAEVHVGIGTLYEKNKDYIRSIQSYEEALRADPQDETAELGIARASLETKNYKTAKDHAVRVVGSAYKSVQQEAYILIGSAELSFNNTKSALEAYTKAIELGSQDPHLHVLIAQTYIHEYLNYIRLNNLEPMSKKALAETEKALAINPNYIYAYVTQHQIYMMLKDTKKADMIGKKIVSFLPKDDMLSKDQKDFYAQYYKEVPTVTVTNIVIENK